MLAAIAVLTSITLSQGEVSFARAQKQGERTAYSFSMSVPAFDSSISGEISVTVAKLQPNGRPELAFGMKNVATTGRNTTAGTISDRTVKVIERNLPPKDFTPAKGSMEHMYLLYLLAASTLDKNVKVGDESPWSAAILWEGGAGTLSFEGTMKIAEVSSDLKTLKAQVTGKILANGNSVGTYTTTNTFSLPDCILTESVGDFHIGTTQEIRFKRLK